MNGSDYADRFPHIQDVSDEAKQMQVRSKDWWWSLITGIELADVQPKKSGRLFGPTDENHPI